MFDKPLTRNPAFHHSKKTEIKLLIFLVGWSFLALAPLSLGALGENSVALFFFSTGLLLVTWQLAKTFGAYSIEIFFLLASFIYTYAAFIDATIFENSKAFDIDYVVWITLLGLTTLFTFFTSVFFRKTPTVNPGNTVSADADKILFSCIIFTALALAAYLNFSREYLGLIQIITRAELYRSVPLAFELVKLTLPILVLICFVSIVLRARRTSLGITLFLGLTTLVFVTGEIVLFGDRRIALSLILALVVLRHSFKPISGIWLLLLLPTAAAFVLLGYFRNQSIDNLALIASNISPIQALNPVNTEFGAFHIVGSTLFELPFWQLVSVSVFQVPLALIPNALFSGRPTAPSIAFVRDYHPEIYNIGGGLAYNLVLEFYQNFWYFGPIILGLVLARSVTLVKTKQNSYVGYLIMWNVFFVFRMDLVSLTRNVLISLLIFGMVKLVATFLFRVER